MIESHLSLKEKHILNMNDTSLATGCWGRLLPAHFPALTAPAPAALAEQVHTSIEILVGAHLPLAWLPVGANQLLHQSHSE
jgi:hypothetical protein